MVMCSRACPLEEVAGWAPEDPPPRPAPRPDPRPAPPGSPHRLLAFCTDNTKLTMELGASHHAHPRYSYSETHMRGGHRTHETTSTLR